MELLNNADACVPQSSRDDTDVESRLISTAFVVIFFPTKQSKDLYQYFLVLPYLFKYKKFLKRYKDD